MKVVGVLTQKIIDIFHLPFTEGTDIYCGESNILHIQQMHPLDFAKYGDQIEIIIKEPDYLCKHPLKSSIEYVKVFYAEDSEHVLVAVRASGSGILYVRTLFVMDPIKIEKYQEKNAFIPYLD